MESGQYKNVKKYRNVSSFFGVFFWKNAYFSYKLDVWEVQTYFLLKKQGNSFKIFFNLWPFKDDFAKVQVVTK